MKKGLKLFGDRAEEATDNELQQIHNIGTYIPMDAKFLSREEKMKAFFHLCLLLRSAMEDLRHKNVQLEVSKRIFQVMLSPIGLLQQS